MQREPVIFTVGMHQGYCALRENIQLDEAGRMLGRGATTILRRAIGDIGTIVEALRDPNVGALKILSRVGRPKEWPFELFDVTYIVLDRRPSGRHAQRLARRLVSAPGMGTITFGSPEIASGYRPTVADDALFFTRPENRPLVAFLRECQGVDPDDAAKKIAEGLLRLRLLNRSGLYLGQNEGQIVFLTKSKK